MAQNAVRGRGMEVEVGECKMAEKLLALQRHGIAGTGGKGDIAAIGAVELFRLERLHIVDGFCEPLLELIEGLFGFGGRRLLGMRKPRHSLCGECARKVNLSGTR